MGGAVVVNGGDGLGSSLIHGLHLQQTFFRVLIDLINVDQLVVDMAEQHHVVDVVGEQWRTNWVAARTRWSVSDDMRDEPKILVFGTRD